MWRISNSVWEGDYRASPSCQKGDVSAQTNVVPPAVKSATHRVTPHLIRGGSLDNAIVLTKHGMLNETGLRFSDEFVRHKILDIIGDLALLGMTLLGRVTAERSGHLLHAALMSSLLRNRAAWEIVDLPTPKPSNGSTTESPR